MACRGVINQLTLSWFVMRASCHFVARTNHKLPAHTAAARSLAAAAPQPLGLSAAVSPLCCNSPAPVSVCVCVCVSVCVCAFVCERKLARAFHIQPRLYQFARAPGFCACAHGGYVAAGVGVRL